MALAPEPHPMLHRSTRADCFALLELPHELLLDITDFLDISDVICLSLCNYALNAKLSHFRHSPHLREERVRRELLLRLAKHDLAVFFCYYCARLHPTSRVPPPALLGVKLPSDALQCLTQQLDKHCFTGLVTSTDDRRRISSVSSISRSPSPRLRVRLFSNILSHARHHPDSDHHSLALPTFASDDAPVNRAADGERAPPLARPALDHIP